MIYVPINSFRPCAFQLGSSFSRSFISNAPETFTIKKLRSSYQHLRDWHHSEIQNESTSERNSIGLIGILEDRNSSFLTGSSKAPDFIRSAFLSDSSNSFSEQCQ